MSAPRRSLTTATAALAAVSIVAAASCAQIIGLEPFSEGTGGAGAASGSQGQSATGAGAGGAGAGTAAGGGGATSTGTGGGCKGGDACFAKPSGWSSPGELVTGGTCESGWVVGLAAVVPPTDTTCTDCSCRPPKAACSATFHFYSDPNCGFEVASFDAPIGCTAFASSGGVLRVDPPAAHNAGCGMIVGASCTPPSVPDVALCLPPPDGDCAGGRCIGPHTAPICVWQAGDTACPPGYPNRRLVYARYVNGPCTCGTVMNQNCAPMQLQFSSDSACNAVGDVSPGVCATVGPVKAVDYAVVDGGSCGDPQAVGTTTDPTTVCCQ